jgi:hypothetical protein
VFTSSELRVEGLEDGLDGPRSGRDADAAARLGRVDHVVEVHVILQFHLGSEAGLEPEIRGRLQPVGRGEQAAGTFAHRRADDPGHVARAVTAARGARDVGIVVRLADARVRVPLRLFGLVVGEHQMVLAPEELVVRTSGLFALDAAKFALAPVPDPGQRVGDMPEFHTQLGRERVAYLQQHDHVSCPRPRG